MNNIKIVNNILMRSMYFLLSKIVKLVQHTEYYYIFTIRHINY